MLIWGTRAVKRELATGLFYCPSCRFDQAYRHVRAQKHGHLYWIPLFSTGEPVEYVECQACRGTFDPRVLEAVADVRADFKAVFEQGMLSVMAAIVVADGEVAEAERQMVSRIYGEVSGHALSATDLNRAIADAERSHDELVRSLSDLEPMLNSEGKELVVRGALMVAMADGHLDDSEGDLVYRLARAIGMTDSHLRGLVGSMQA